MSPTADVPYRALQNGAKLVFVYKVPTVLDERAEVSFTGDVAEFLPLVAVEVFIEE